MTLAPLRNRTPLPLTDQQIAQARADLAATGAAVLAGFVAADEADAMLAEVEPVLDQAYSKPKVHNVYLVADDRSLPQSHPRNAKVPPRRRRWPMTGCQRARCGGCTCRAKCAARWPRSWDSTTCTPMPIRWPG